MEIGCAAGRATIQQGFQGVYKETPLLGLCPPTRRIAPGFGTLRVNACLFPAVLWATLLSPSFGESHKDYQNQGEWLSRVLIERGLEMRPPFQCGTFRGVSAAARGQHLIDGKHSNDWTRLHPSFERQLLTRGDN